MKVGRSVIARISATTISTLSVPIPVDTTDTRWPRYVPVAEANSRCRRSSSIESRARGDPGGAVGVAGEEDVLGQFSRSEADVVLPFSNREVRRRWSAFGKPSPSLRWLLRKRETRPRIAPRSNERQARTSVVATLGHAQPTLEPRSAPARAGRRAPPAVTPGASPAGEAGRDADRSSRRACRRRSIVTASEHATEQDDASHSRPAPGSNGPSSPPGRSSRGLAPSRAPARRDVSASTARTRPAVGSPTRTRPPRHRRRRRGTRRRPPRRVPVALMASPGSMSGR